ncbi:histidinol phosphate phosphatase domain-containing protein [Dissulfurimicrobium hydrothermale]|nr:histidinol phosphate phosphatase domain-containing protein [Dissulfurimicrobium hydrothermale]UKL14634.1 histidinol phosphate phosphatase domain-containing protein [Dissulfurimicrobium hydrothermale]
MFDLHCHSLFSDGELLPSELVRRAEAMGYKAVAITDHADSSNLEHILLNIRRAADDINKYSQTRLIPGIELTHVHPRLIDDLAKKARGFGAKIVVCHGETIVEPVYPGTNHAALKADIDILAHPGFITPDDVKLAAGRGIMLELSGRKGHSLTNGHVARLAMKHGAHLVVNSDGHAPSDFMTAEMARKIAMGAGLSEEEAEDVFNETWRLISAIDLQS